MPTTNQLSTIQPQGFPGLPAGWTTDWETLPGADGKTKLFNVTFRRESGLTPRALFVIHGFGEHIGRYLHVPHYLQNVVDSVHGLDMRGHGRSEGLRGHIERFDDMVDDCVSAILRLDQQLKKKFGRSEIHLLGHSMGGHLALRALFLNPELPVVTANISAPFLGIKAKVPVSKKVAARALSRVWGTLQMDTNLKADNLSHDKAVPEAYLADRLVHGKMTPRFYTELQAAMSDTMRRTTGINHPLQMLLPMQDSVVDPEKSLHFFRELKTREKRLKTYPGFYHEPMNEVGKEKVFEDLCDWISSHSKQVEGE